MQPISLSMNVVHRSSCLALLAGASLLTNSAWAQEPAAPDRSADQTRDAGGAETDAAGTARTDGSVETNGNVDGDGNGDGTMDPEMEDHSEARPEPPGGTAIDEDGRLEDPKIIEGAGMGSDVAYATRGVVELGGSLGLDIREEVIDFVVAPTVGYFIADRVELSLIPVIRVQNVGDPDTDADETNVRLALILEPSYHLPLSEIFYAFAGVGLGITYEEGPGVDFLVRPVIGMDIMIGRSGILKPSGFLDLGVGDGALGGGFLAGYTVMF